MFSWDNPDDRVAVVQMNAELRHARLEMLPTCAYSANATSRRACFLVCEQKRPCKHSSPQTCWSE